MLIAAVTVITIADFHWVGQRVQYAEIRPPVIRLLDRSEVFRLLQPTDRVLAMDGNTLALSGAACVPPYLGMGPAEYYAKAVGAVPIEGSQPGIYRGLL